MAKNPYASLAAQKPTTLETIAALASGAEASGATVSFSTGQGRSSFKVIPSQGPSVADVLAAQPVAAASPNWFQQVNADGTIGPNWTRIALVGGGVLALGVALSMMRRRGR